MKVMVHVFVVLWGLTVTRLPLLGEEHFFVSGGVRIHYVGEGKGDPVVLVHGFTGSIAGWVDPGVMANLSRDYRVIALDLRGHGKSGKPHDSGAYGENLGIDVIRLMDHLGIAKAHIVGYSQGARITGYLLTTYPNRFITATLGGSPAQIDWPESDAQRAEEDAQHMEQQSISGIKDGQDYLALAAMARARRRLAVTKDQIGRVKIPTMAIVVDEVNQRSRRCHLGDAAGQRPGTSAA